MELLSTTKLVVCALFFFFFLHVEAYSNNHYKSYDPGYSSEVRWNHAASTIDQSVNFKSLLHPDQLQRVVDFRLSPVSVLLCKQWATEQYILQRKQASPELASRRSSQESVAVKIRDHIGFELDENTSTADLLARQICRPLLWNQRNDGAAYGRQYEDSRNSNQQRDQYLNRLGRKETNFESRFNHASWSDSYGNQFNAYGSGYDYPYSMYDHIAGDPDELLNRWLHDSGLSGMPLQGAPPANDAAKPGSLIGNLQVVFGDTHLIDLDAMRMVCEAWQKSDVSPLFEGQRSRRETITQQQQADPDANTKAKSYGLLFRDAAIKNSEVQNFVQGQRNTFRGYPKNQLEQDTGFTYRLGGRGKVIAAWGPVPLESDGTDAKAAPIDYTTQLYMLQNAQAKYELPGVWEVGHVVAASLGGSNYAPVNFFPQHTSSNKGYPPGISTWAAAEAFANALRPLQNDRGRLSVYITLTYQTDADVVPSGGKYTVAWSDEDGRFKVNLATLDSNLCTVCPGSVSTQRGNLPPLDASPAPGTHSRTWAWTNP